MGWLALTIKITIGVIGGLLAIGGIAYAMDVSIDAVVTQKNCGGTGNPYFPHVLGADSTVTVQTRLFGIGHTVSLSRDVCLALRPNNYVVYHIRSGHTVLYEDGSQTHCMYDSATSTGACA